MDNTTAFPPPTTPAVGPQPNQDRPRRRRGAGHIVAIVIGCLLLLPGLGMAAGGGVALVGQAVATDDDGYFEMTLDRLSTDEVAIAATDIRFDADAEAADWLFDWLDVDVRLTVDGARSTDDVFVGIARSDDVERYLAGAGYSEVVELDGRTPVYVTVPGNGPIEPPLTQDFWTASTSGSETQVLTWEARPGRWSAVVMNTDGSPTVAADVEVGAKTGALTPIAVTLLVVGGLVTVTAVVLIVVGARGRRSPDALDTSGDDGSPDDSPFGPPPAESPDPVDDESHTPLTIG